MIPERFVLRRMTFTGPQVAVRDVDFSGGLTVIWGGSQAGKSFTVKALDYMFGGGSPLPVLKESVGYEKCWLEWISRGVEG